MPLISCLCIGVEFNYGAAGVPFSELSVFGDQIVVALGGYGKTHVDGFRVS